MAITRQRQPWTDLLDAGREDERLVREAFEGGTAPRLPPAPPPPPPPPHAPPPPRRARPPKLLEALDRIGVEQLYSHQAGAVEAAMTGPFIVTTGTASGKSLCFN